MFEQFEKHKHLFDKNDLKNIFVSVPGTYMMLWYGLLFAVCGYLKDNNSIPKTIEQDVNSIYESLRLFRNAVFHVQDKYYTHKLFSIMKDNNSVHKIRKIHDTLGNYFLEEMKRSQASE
ncbi:MAG: hypothetical protein H6696_06760 [Deferribacteres bacterium]|nr:hypothetical protein [Deferribacteres bacterium]